MGDLLFAPDRQSDCAAAVRGFLVNKRGEWDRIDLQELRAGSPFLNGGQPDQCTADQCSICPVLDLSGWPASMDSKYRTDVRRATNRLAKQPRLWNRSGEHSE